jgi:hypothetical protein
MKIIRPRVSPRQLNLALGDWVEYQHDDGHKTLHPVSGYPAKLGGHTWVIWLDGVVGCVALSRCKPTKFYPAAAQ